MAGAEPTSRISMAEDKVLGNPHDSGRSQRILDVRAEDPSLVNAAFDTERTYVRYEHM
jgi:hypothetical protein